MTTGAGNAATLVITAFPADVIFVFMAIETHTVLLFYRDMRLVSERYYRWTFLTRAYLASMPAFFNYFFQGFRPRNTWSVTGFALQAGKW